MSNRKKWVVMVGISVWLMGVAAGLTWLAAYENSPGTAGTPPAHWPAGTQIARQTGRATLVMLAHPRCPCTRASLYELAVLKAELRERISILVLFYRPEDAPNDWEKTDLWFSAAAIPGVTVMADPGGAEAARFGAEVSGQTALYGANGELLFRGGITASRGHSGDNAGCDAIVAFVLRGAAERTSAFVFGCALHARAETQSIKPKE